MSEPRVLILYPYLHDDTCWVFDDERTGLTREAFVLGMSEMISRLVDIKGIPAAAAGFAMAFAAEPFSGHDVVLDWQRPGEGGGNWYAGDVCGERMEGWLCPALFCYFPAAPEKIYVQADPLPAGVNPIWTPPDDAEPRAFVESPR